MKSHHDSGFRIPVHIMEELYNTPYSPIQQSYHQFFSELKVKPNRLNSNVEELMRWVGQSRKEDDIVPP